MNDWAFFVARRLCYGGHRDAPPLLKGGKLGATHAGGNHRSLDREFSTARPSGALVSGFGGVRAWILFQNKLRGLAKWRIWGIVNVQVSPRNSLCSGFWNGLGSHAGSGRCVPPFFLGAGAYQREFRLLGTPGKNHWRLSPESSLTLRVSGRNDALEAIKAMAGTIGARIRRSVQKKAWTIVSPRMARGAAMRGHDQTAG
jgi:hypothetical protein